MTADPTLTATVRLERLVRIEEGESVMVGSDGAEHVTVYVVNEAGEATPILVAAQYARIVATDR
jgi:hypothetical protein